MSDLDDFLGAAFDEAETIIGTVSFTISGVSGTFTGIIDRTATSEAMNDEGGGFMPSADATIVADIDQFPGQPGKNLNLTIGSEVFTILRIEADSITYTFSLAATATGG